MNCDKLKKYYDDFILGEVDQALEIQINEHLAECKICQKEIEEREILLNLFKMSQKFKPSHEVYARVRDSIGVTRKEKKILLWGLPRSFVYTVAAFLLGVVLMRTVDVLLFRPKEVSKVEIMREPQHRKPFSDTVQFYSAPSENLVKL